MVYRSIKVVSVGVDQDEKEWEEETGEVLAYGQSPPDHVSYYNSLW